jgi:hypothetical protein
MAGPGTRHHATKQFSASGLLRTDTEYRTIVQQGNTEKTRFPEVSADVIFRIVMTRKALLEQLHESRQRRVASTVLRHPTIIVCMDLNQCARHW